MEFTFYTSRDAKQEEAVLIMVESQEHLGGGISTKPLESLGPSAWIIIVSPSVAPLFVPSKCAHIQVNTNTASQSRHVVSVRKGDGVPAWAGEIEACPAVFRTIFQVAAFLVLRCRLFLCVEQLVQLVHSTWWAGDNGTAGALLQYIAAADVSTSSSLALRFAQSYDQGYSSQKRTFEIVSCTRGDSLLPLDVLIIAHGKQFVKNVGVVLGFLHSTDRICAIIDGYFVIDAAEKRHATLREKHQQHISAQRPRDPSETLAASWAAAAPTLKQWKRKPARMRVVLFMFDKEFDDVAILAQQPSPGFSPITFMKRNDVFSNIPVVAVGFGETISGRYAFEMANLCNGRFHHLRIPAESSGTQWGLLLDKLIVEWRKTEATSVVCVGMSTAASNAFQDSSVTYSSVEMPRSRARALFLGSAVCGQALRGFFQSTDPVLMFMTAFSTKSGKFELCRAADSSSMMSPGKDAVTIAGADWWKMFKAVRNAVLFSKSSDPAVAARQVAAVLEKSKPELVTELLKIPKRNAPRESAKGEDPSTEDLQCALLELVHTLVKEDISGTPAAQIERRSEQQQENRSQLSQQSESSMNSTLVVSEIKRSKTNETPLYVSTTEKRGTKNLAPIEEIEKTEATAVVTETSHYDPSFPKVQRQLESSDDEDSSKEEEEVKRRALPQPQQLQRKEKQKQEGVPSRHVNPAAKPPPQSEQEDAAATITAITNEQARVSNPLVDPRWTGFSSNLPTVSSFAAALPRHAPSGISTRCSFSLQLKSLANNAVYVEFVSSPAFQSAKSKLKHRQVFLCQIEPETQGLTVCASARLPLDAEEHTFYDVGRSKKLCVIQLASEKAPVEWISLDNLLIADGIEFVTPTFFTSCLNVVETHPRSVAIEWDGTGSSFIVTVTRINARSDGEEEEEEEETRSFSCNHTACNVHSLSPATLYYLSVRPSTLNPEIVVEGQNIIFATSPDVSSQPWKSDATAIEEFAKVFLQLEFPSIVKDFGKYALTCTPIVKINDIECDQFILSPDHQAEVEVIYEMTIRNVLADMTLSQRRSTTPFTTVLGPYHTISEVRVSDITCSTANFAWKSTGSKFRVEVSKDQVNGGTDEDVRECCTVVEGKTHASLPMLDADGAYTAVINGENCTNTATVKFRTPPVPPNSIPMKLLHSLANDSLCLTLPRRRVSSDRGNREEFHRVELVQVGEIYESEKEEDVTKELQLKDYPAILTLALTNVVTVDGVAISSPPTHLHPTRNLSAFVEPIVSPTVQNDGTVAHNPGEVEFRWASSARAFNVGLGTNFKAVQECTAVFPIPLGAPQFLPVAIQGPNVVSETSQLLFLTPPPKLSASLFDLVLFEDRAEISVDQTSVKRLYEQVEEAFRDLVEYTIVFNSTCFDPVYHVLSATKDHDQKEFVTVKLMLNRGKDATISAGLIATALQQRAKERNILCLNDSSQSPIVSLPTAAVFGIYDLEVREIYPFSVSLRWQTLCSVCDVEVTAANGFKINCRTNEQRITMEGLAPETCYIATICSKESGGHSESVAFVTPTSGEHYFYGDVAKTVVVEGNNLQCTIPSITKHVGGENQLETLCVVRLWSDPPMEWVSRSSGAFEGKAVLPMMQPSEGEQWPHLTVHSISRLPPVSAKALASAPAPSCGPQKRVDIVGKPTLEEINTDKLSVSWLGSALAYSVSYTIDGDPNSGRTLRKELSRVTIDVIEHRGKLLSFDISSADTLSNKIVFSVIIPTEAPSVFVSRHTPKNVTAVIDAPIVEKNVVSEYLLVAGNRTYVNDSIDKKEQQVTFSIDSNETLSEKIEMIYIRRLSLQKSSPKFAECLNREVDVSSTTVLPQLHIMKDLSVVSVGTSTVELRWTSAASEFFISVVSHLLKAAGDVAEQQQGEEQTFTRRMITATSTAVLRSLPPGALHEITVRGRTCGDIHLSAMVMTLPELHEKSIVFRRSKSGMKCTVMGDFPVNEYICADNIKVTGRSSVELFDERERKIESIDISEEGGCTFGLEALVTTVLFRRTLLAPPDKILNATVSSHLALCRVPLMEELTGLELQSVTTNSIGLQWKAASRRCSYHVELSPAATLLPKSGPLHTKSTVVEGSIAVVTGLTPATLYRARIKEEAAYPLHVLTNSKSLIVHDDAPPTPFLECYVLTKPKRIFGAPHRRFPGGLTVTFDGEVLKNDTYNITQYNVVRLIPDNIAFVPELPQHSHLPAPEPSLPVVAEELSFVVGSRVEGSTMAGDVVVKEPATPTTHRIEFFSVLEVDPLSSIAPLIMNKWQWSEPDLQSIEMIRTVSRPQVVHATSHKAEISWSSSHSILRCDVSLKNLVDDSYPDIVNRVADSKVIVSGLRPGTSYFTVVSPSYNDVPCEPLRFIILSAPKRPKAPTLHTALLNVVFDLPSTEKVKAFDPELLGDNQSSKNEEFFQTTSFTALMICSQDVDVSSCVTAFDFLEKTQARNVFKSSTAIQRIDVRLRSGKEYYFVFFTTTHHPMAVNGIIHSKPAVVIHHTDCFAPQNLHVISRTKASITVGWGTVDHGSKNLRFTVERVLVPRGTLGNKIDEATFEDYQNVERREIETTPMFPELHCTFSDLCPDDKYAFRVRQVTNNFFSPWSSMIVAQTLLPPKPVEKIEVLGVTPTTIRLSWVDSQPRESREQLSYIVTYRPTDKLPRKQELSAPKNGYEIRVYECTTELKNLIAGAQYRISVIPCNHLGERSAGTNAVVNVRTESPQSWK